VLPKRPEFWNRALVGLALVGTYTNFALNVGTLVYGFVTFTVGVLLLVIHRRAFVRRWDLVVSLLLVCGLIDVGGTGFPEIWIELVTSTLLLLACVVAGIGVFLELRTWPRLALSRLCTTATVLVLAFGILEHFQPFRDFSDVVRQLLYSHDSQFLYVGDDRDVALHGAIRPKVFTQEPSHPAKFVAVATTIWFLLSKRKDRTVIALLGCAAGYLILRSPSIFVGPILIAYFSFFGTSRITGRFAGVKVTALLVTLLAMATLPEWVGLLPGARAEAIANSKDGSMIMRLSAPLAISYEAIAHNPLFGLGIGGKEVATDMVFSIYARYTEVNLDYQFQQNEVYGWGNGLFQFVAYCGVFGSALFLGWYVRFCKRLLTPDWPSLLIVFFLLLAVDGGFNMLRPWSYFFFVAAALHIEYRDNSLRRLFPPRFAEAPP